MSRGWFPTAIAVLAVALDARADDATAPPVIVITAEAPTVLPAMRIEGRPPVIAIAADAPAVTTPAYRIDPRTGLMIPGDAEGRGRGRRTSNVAGGGAPARGLRLDPETGLLIPNFLTRPERRHRRVAASSAGTSSNFHHDRATGLMVPNGPPAARTEPPAGASITLDPATGLMVPAAFVQRAPRRRSD